MCNLGREHTRCPNGTRVATGPSSLADAVIVASIHAAYRRFGFTGLVGWHYYNEPMLSQDRMYSIMEQLPHARFVLWTNGTVKPDGRVEMFEQIHVTDYGSVHEGYRGLPNLIISKPRFDGRLKDSTTNDPNDLPCWRQHVEFIIDAWGTAHLCCQDWRREIVLGNLWYVPFASVLASRAQILRQMRLGNYPPRCTRCQGKLKHLPVFDKSTYERTLNGKA